MNRTAVALVVAAALGGALHAQCANLGFTGASNGQSGIMFAVDNVSANPVTVLGLGTRFLGNGTATLEIYSVAGSFVGNESSAAFWGAPVATVAGFGHTGGLTYPPIVPIPAALNLPVAPGTRRSFWLT